MPSARLTICEEFSTAGTAIDLATALAARKEAIVKILTNMMIIISGFDMRMEIRK
jgi:hypothetical protein